MRAFLLPAFFACAAFGLTPAIPKVDRLSANPSATYHVRDLYLNRGDAKLYLSDGLLSFFRPIDGHVVGALFSAIDVESGDAEILVIPPVPSERASLVAFTGSPNMDEHLRAAVFFFADDTATELRHQVEQHGSSPAPNEASALDDKFAPVMSDMRSAVDFRLIESMLDGQNAEQGFFYAVLFGRTLGQFNMLYEPELFEPLTIGRGSTGKDGVNEFEIWASFRPRGSAVFEAPPNRFANYRIHARIHQNLELEAQCEFDYQVLETGSRVLRFDLSRQLAVTEVLLDGQAAGVLQRSMVQNSQARAGGAFLLVSGAPLAPGRHHVSVRYRGNVIRQTDSGTYLVDERTNWFPRSDSLLSSFDLTFQCPDYLQLVATGEPAGNEVKDGTRTVHRISSVPRPFAGFNLGRYDLAFHAFGPYRVELYSESGTSSLRGDLGAEAGRVLEFYTQLWHRQASHTLAISPISGYFGQGFPGLLYLSTAAFIAPEARDPLLKTERFDIFLSRLLLPHEVAHQWWGNMMFPSSYRSGWLIEALASYSALQYVEKTAGRAEVEKILNHYRTDLLQLKNGATVESAGSLDWGTRLLTSKRPDAWQPIVYGKGTWVLHMLKQRLGETGFVELQRRILERFSERPISNEDFRKLAAELLPKENPVGARDPQLQQFFDTWVYDTGLPALQLRRVNRNWILDVTQVDDEYTVDVPLTCRNGGQNVQVTVRAAKGQNTLPGGGRQFTSCSLPSSASFLSAN